MGLSGASWSGGIEERGQLTVGELRRVATETAAPTAGYAQGVGEGVRQAAGQEAQFGSGGPVVVKEGPGVAQEDLAGRELGALNRVRSPGDRAVPFGE
ncbi:hypothetical protein [Streptomyces kronopolitis]|uniref:hypothetical protein n=1 Tax=Streptomyces kronopolitis TaxID=1612435 RepID=UPI003439536D